MAKWNNTDHRRGDNFRRGNTRDTRQSSGRNKGGASYTPNNKALGIFAAVAVGLTVISLGPGVIFDAVGSVGENLVDAVFDSFKSSKPSSSHSSNNSSSSRPSNSSSSSSSSSNKSYEERSKKQKYTKSDYDTDLELDDIKDIYEDLTELRDSLAQDDVELEEVTKIAVEFSAFETIGNYKEAVVSRLNDFKHPVSFVAKCTTPFSSEEEAKAIFNDKANTVIYSDEGRTIEHEKFNKINVSATFESEAYKNETYLTMVVTFH